MVPAPLFIRANSYPPKNSRTAARCVPRFGFSHLSFSLTARIAGRPGRAAAGLAPVAGDVLGRATVAAAGSGELATGTLDAGSGAGVGSVGAVTGSGNTPGVGCALVSPVTGKLFSAVFGAGSGAATG